MGFLDKVIDVATSPLRLSRDAILGDPADKRAAAEAMRAQVDAYRKQTELAEGEIARKRDEENTQRRRIEEKMIRGKRRGFAPSGFLDNEAGVSNTLGG